MRKWKRIGVFLLTVMLFGQLLYYVQAEPEYGLKKILVNPEDDSDTDFGCSVAVNDEYVFIGAIRAAVGELIQAGEVCQFDLNGEHIKSFQSEEPVQQDKFGWAIFAGHDKLLVTESEESYIGASTGQSYLYSSDGSIIKVIDSPIQDKNTYFGYSTAILPDKFIVGSPFAGTEEVAFAGRVHVFDETGNLLDTMSSPNPAVAGGYGFRVVADEDLIVVTEMHSVLPEMQLIKGIVYVYDSDWELLHTLTGSNPEKNNFGYTLALSDEYIFIGDKTSTTDDVERAGKVYVYNRQGELVDSIEPTNPVSGSYFSECMAIYDDILIIGEPWSDEGMVDAGKVYVYQTDGTLLAELVSPEPTIRGLFGESVAIYGDDIIVGEYGANKAYIFSKGASGEVETETTEETVSEETTTTEEKQDNAIPGYPLPVIILGIASVTLILMYRRKTPTPFFNLAGADNQAGR